MKAVTQIALYLIARNKLPKKEIRELLKQGIITEDMIPETATRWKTKRKSVCRFCGHKKFCPNIHDDKEVETCLRCTTLKGEPCPRCPHCEAPGAEEKHHEGYWFLVCRRCGTKF
jgi:hypothetical protein